MASATWEPMPTLFLGVDQEGTLICGFGCGCGSSWAPPAHPTPEHPSCRKLETLDLSHDPLVHVTSFRHGAFGTCHRTTTARAHPRLRVRAHEARPGAPVPVPRKPVHRRRPWRVLPRPSRLPDRAAAGSQPAAGRPPGPRGPQGAAGAASEPQEDQVGLYAWPNTLSHHAPLPARGEKGS